jgi:hypothetical protein
MSGSGWDSDELAEALVASYVDHHMTMVASYIDHVEEQLCRGVDVRGSEASNLDDWDWAEVSMALEESLREPPTPDVCAICMENTDTGPSSVLIIR